MKKECKFSIKYSTPEIRVLDFCMRQVLCGSLDSGIIDMEINGEQSDSDNWQ